MHIIAITSVLSYLLSAWVIQSEKNEKELK